MTDQTIMPIRYLGDGVYASFDGYHIWLRTERDDVVHEIALEPAVFDELFNYQTDVRTFCEAVAKAEKPS